MKKEELREHINMLSEFLKDFTKEQNNKRNAKNNTKRTEAERLMKLPINNFKIYIKKHKELYSFFLDETDHPELVLPETIREQYFSGDLKRAIAKMKNTLKEIE